MATWILFARIVLVLQTAATFLQVPYQGVDGNLGKGIGVHGLHPLGAPAGIDASDKLVCHVVELCHGQRRVPVCGLGRDKLIK